MRLAAKVPVLVVVGVTVVVGSAFSALANSSCGEVGYKHRGVELDAHGRTIQSPLRGKINYLLNDLQTDTGSSSFSNQPGLKSHKNAFQSHLSLPADTFSLEKVWTYGIFGSGIGSSGIITGDIDNDGVVEIICGGGTSTFGLDDFWYVLEYSPVSSEYSMQWISELYLVGITNIAGFDPNGDDIYSIFVGFSDGDIRVYDAASLQETNVINSAASCVNRIVCADPDNDASSEIVFCDDDTMFMYNASTLFFEHRIPYGASDFEVGDVDADPENEIVMANGKVIEYNGVTPTLEWDYLGGDFGYLVELSDIDSDNMKEIIAAEDWYYITAFDADIQSPKWQITADLDIDALLMTDVDGDAIEEVIYGDGQWGEIHCMDAITRVEKWQISNPEHGVTDIAVYDTDLDTDLEILWGAGASSTGADYLYVHNASTQAFEWQSRHVDGPFYAIDVGDVDSDGEQEIVFVTFESNSGYDDGVLFIYDAATDTLEWESGVDMFGGFAWTGIHDVKIGDVDDDGVTEIVVATDSLYDGAIYVINGISHAIEQSYFYDSGAPMYSIVLADVDNDTDTEIIAGAGREHTGAPGVYVYVINGSTGVVEWNSISLGDYWSIIYAVEVDDIDNDTVPEIVAINDNIFVFDGITHQMWQSTLEGCLGLDLVDTDDDNIEEIVVGTDSGRVISIDGQSYAQELNFNVSSSPIVGLRGYDVDQNGNLEIVFASSNELFVYSVEFSQLVWQSGILGSLAGNYNSLVTSDNDSDDRTEVIIGTNYTVVEFEGPYYGNPVEEEFSFRPADARLFQNYPNPVRTTATISYVLPESGDVKLEVYNTSGQLVETLVNVRQKAGTHSVEWDAEALASGVFFYRIETANYTDAKKCIVVK